MLHASVDTKLHLHDQLDKIIQFQGGGGHYISACTSTRDRGQDLDPANFHA